MVIQCYYRSNQRGGGFKAILFLRCSDETRYGNLLDQLKYVSHIVRYEYPITVSSTYDLFVRHSGGFYRNRRRKVVQIGDTSRPHVMFLPGVQISMETAV